MPLEAHGRSHQRHLEIDYLISKAISYKASEFWSVVGQKELAAEFLHYQNPPGRAPVAS